MHGRYGVTMTRILAAIGLIWSTWLAAAPPMVDGDADGVSDEIDLCLYSRPGDVVNRVGCTMQDDSDADGVPDNVDFCLGTPAGRAVDPFGCETGAERAPLVAVDDGDGDGVSDREDVCPYSDAGALVDPDGCALDSDFDGVANGLDRCPSSPLGQVVNAQGCPAPVSAPSTARPASPPPSAARVPVSPPAQLPDPGVDVRGTAEQIASLATPAELAALGRELLRLSGLAQPVVSAQQLQAPALAPPPLQAASSRRPLPIPQPEPAPALASEPAFQPAPVVREPRQAAPRPSAAVPPSAPQALPLPVAPLPAPPPTPVLAESDPAPVAAPMPVPPAVQPAPLPPVAPEPAVAPIPLAPVRVVSSGPTERFSDSFAADLQFVRGSSELDGRIMSLLRERKLNWLAELQADARRRLEVVGNQEDPPALAELRAQIVRAYLMAMGLPPRRIVVKSGATGGASTRVRLGDTLEQR